MAVDQLPLNDFKLITKNLVSGSLETVYTVPETATGVILSCQISNTTDQEQIVTVKTKRGEKATQVEEGEIDEGQKFSLVTKGVIPPKDVLNPLTGRLIVEETDQIVIEGSSDDIQINLSVLETANE